MNHACESVIRLDQQIKFVCIVDEYAKLLVGQDRSIPTDIKSLKTSETTDSSTHTNKSKIDELVEIHFKYRNIYLFYSDYLLWVIKSCTVHLDDTKNKDYSYITHVTNKFETSFFELSGLDSDSVKLAVTPLNTRMRTFLCIYFEPSYSIKSSIEDENKRFKILLQKIHVIVSLHSKILDSV
ncbi:MAG: hypothetical protein WA941_14720 [Nitrososphaeraceae archaeon]